MPYYQSREGAKLVFLLLYSPDLSPVELCWSKLKQLLRSAKARTREALDQALTKIINDCISSDDALGSLTVAYSSDNRCKMALAIERFVDRPGKVAMGVCSDEIGERIEGAVCQLG